MPFAFCLLLAGGADLEQLAARCRFEWTADAAGRHTLMIHRTEIVFVPGSDKYLLNGVEMTVTVPPSIEGGRVKVPFEIARQIEVLAVGGPVVAAPAPRPPKDPPKKVEVPAFTIVIDPGHGGIWTGYVGRAGVMEKDINLEVSLELQKILESWGGKVVLTRSTDRHFSADRDDDLDHRVQMVNRTKPDLFLSVHTNGVANPGPRGFEVWVPLNERDARGRASRELAELVRGELGGVWSSDDRGTKDEHNLYVLKHTRCPAALVELEFVSNPAAERQLARSSVRRKLAEALAEAVRKWIAARK